MFAGWPSRAHIWLFTSLQILFLAGAVADVCDAPFYNITDQASADQIRHCGTVAGDIYIFGLNQTLISLNGVQSIMGSLYFNDGASYVSFTQNFLAPDLTIIHGSLTTSYYGAQNMTFPILTTIGGINIDCSGSRVIESLNFPSGLSQWSGDPGSIVIIDSAITTLDGIMFSSIQELDLSSNNNLQNLTIYAEQMGTESSTIMIEWNGRGPFLNSTYHFDLHFPNLRRVGGYFSLWGIDELDVPQLQNIDAPFQIEGVRGSTLEFPALVNASTQDGGITIDSSVTLNNVLFPVLENITVLSFSDIETQFYSNLVLPKVQHIGLLGLESFNNSTSYAGLNCSAWDQFICNGTATDVWCLQSAEDEYLASKICPNEGNAMLSSSGYVVIGMLLSLAIVL